MEPADEKDRTEFLEGRVWISCAVCHHVVTVDRDDEDEDDQPPASPGFGVFLLNGEAAAVCDSCSGEAR